MGNQKSSQQGNIQTVGYGYHRLQQTQSQQTLVIKTYSLGSQEELRQFNQLTRLFQQELKLPTILQLKSTQQIGPLQIDVAYEYCPQTLKVQIENKKSTYTRYSQQNILNQIDCTLSALMALNFHELFHKDLRPDNIFIGADPQNIGSIIYKIGYPLLMNPKTMEKCYTPVDAHKIDVYFSPQVFQSVNRFKNRPYSLEKSEVFSLGLIALEMANLQSCASIYNHQTGQVSPLEISKHLSACGERYSSSFVALIRDMLAIEESDRPSFEELLIIFEPLMQGNTPTFREFDFIEPQINKLADSRKSKAPIQDSRLSNRSHQRSASHSLIPIFCHVAEPSLLKEIYIPSHSTYKF